LSEHFRRTDPRYDRALQVELSVRDADTPASGTRLIGATRNISLGGIFVEVAEPVPVGTRLLVKFSIPTQPEVIEVLGEVRWIDAGSNKAVVGMGIRFEGLRAREVWALNRYFQS